MAIVFFNNWKTDKEMILIELSFKETTKFISVTLALIGFGVVMVKAKREALIR